MDGKIDPFISFPPPSSSSVSRERTGRYPDRKHGPWTSPSFFFCSLERQRRGGVSPLRAIAPGFVLLVSVALSSFFLLSAFLSLRVPSLSVFIRAPPPSPLPFCPALLPISALFPVHLHISSIGILFLQLLLHPFTIHLCYVTDTFIQGVRTLNFSFFAIDSYDSRLGEEGGEKKLFQRLFNFFFVLYTLAAKPISFYII